MTPTEPVHGPMQFHVDHPLDLHFYIHGKLVVAPLNSSYKLVLLQPLLVNIVPGKLKQFRRTRVKYVQSKKLNN